MSLPAAHGPSAGAAPTPRTNETLLPKLSGIVALIGLWTAIAIGLANQVGYEFWRQSNLLGGPVTLVLGVAILLAGILVTALGTPNPWVIGLAITIGGTCFAPIFSALLKSQHFALGGIAIALVLAGATLCAGQCRPATLRTTAFWVLVALICASLAVAAENLIFGGTFAFRSHYGPRHAEYLPIPVLSGVTGHQNTMGFICALALPVQWILVRRSRRTVGELTWPHWLVLLVVGPGATVVALLWSQSKTALATAVLGMIVVCLPLARLTGRLWAVAWASLLVVLTVAPLVIGFAGLTSFTGRTEMWSYAWADFRAHPVLGYGAGFMSRSGYWDDKATFPDLYGGHNQIMDMLGRTGLAGVGWFIAFAVLMAVLAWRARTFDKAVTVGVVVVYAVTATQEAIVPLATTHVEALRETYLPIVLALALAAAAVNLTPGLREHHRHPQPVSDAG